MTKIIMKRLVITVIMSSRFIIIIVILFIIIVIIIIIIIIMMEQLSIGVESLLRSRCLVSSRNVVGKRTLRDETKIE